MLLSACAKEDFIYDAEHSDDPFYGTIFYSDPVPVPCDYDVNSCSQNYDANPLNFNNVEVVYSSFGEPRNWGIEGYDNTMSNERIRIRFEEAPDAGMYVTVTDNGQTMGDNQCMISGMFWYGGTGANFHASPGDTVYVSKTTTNEYSLSFCNLHYTRLDNSILYEFDTGSGNLTATD